MNCGQGCLECSSVDTCVKCEQNAVLDANTGQCSCKGSYYFDTGANACAQCSDNCLNCDSLEVCSECDQDYVVGNDGSCISTICSDGQYFNV